MSAAVPRNGRAAVALALLIAVGWFIGDLTGLLTGLGAAVLLVAAGPRWVATAALAALFVSAVATVTQAPLLRLYGLAFAYQRPVAASGALVGGVLLVFAVAGFGWRERTRASAECTDDMA